MDFRNFLRSGLGTAGSVLGGPLGGAAAGLAGGYLLGRGGKQQPQDDARSRYAAISARLNSQAEQDPYSTAGYRAEVAGAQDAMREDAQGDAARAGTLGLSPGMATAAGAGQRARALAGLQRGAVGRAEGRQDRLRGTAASLARDEAQMEMSDRDRRDRQKAGWMNAIAGLGASAAGAYFDPRRRATNAG